MTDDLAAELRAMREELVAMRQELRALRDRVTTPRASSITVTAAANRLGCARTRIFELLASGALTRGKRFGHEATVTVESLEALERPETSTPAPKRQELPVSLPPAPSPEEEEAALREFRQKISSRRSGRSRAVKARTVPNDSGRDS